jgi:DNA modification methylase
VTPYYEHAGITIFNGDCIATLAELEPESIQCCITSPPYWGLRDYGVPGQLGLEATPAEYVARMVDVFTQVWRVLRDDGTLWLNLGDSYAGSWGAQSREHAGKQAPNVSAISANQVIAAQRKASNTGSIPPGSGLKPKDMVGIPWRVAFALQAAGWYLRSEIIWSKPNVMPESVTDRPTKAHETIFLLAKSERYYYDAEAIKEPASPDTHARYGRAHNGYSPPGQTPQNGIAVHGHRPPGVNPKAAMNAPGSKQSSRWATNHNGIVETRNKRTVWTVPSEGLPDAHFATFPPDLILPAVLAGCPGGGVILDPFSGAGTTALVAKTNGRRAVGVELNREYCDIAARRLSQDVLEFA